MYEKQENNANAEHIEQTDTAPKEMKPLDTDTNEGVSQKEEKTMAEGLEAHPHASKHLHGAHHHHKLNAELVLKLQSLKKENAELNDSILRAKAENENLRKRYTQQIEDANKYAITAFSKDIIEVLENLYRAESHIDPNNEALKGTLDGIKMTVKSMEAVFAKYRITRIYPSAKELFNHDQHQAISYQVHLELPENTIVQVVQSGYMMHDRLLRPAMVIVSKTQ